MLIRTGMVPLFGFGLAAACATVAGKPGEPLPPPCPTELAARVAADSSLAVTQPTALRLEIPPERPWNMRSATMRVALVVGVDGGVVPESVSVSGTDNERFHQRMEAWAKGLRFRPATYQGCAVERATSLEVTV